MKVLCDFDGTAAQNDVGNLFFRTFADIDLCLKSVLEWKRGHISSKQCLIEECRVTRVTQGEMERFSDRQNLDPHFVDFYRYCQSLQIEIEIVSDGLDFYIERILKRTGLHSKIRFHANHLTFVDPNRILPTFPHYDQGCGRCANCKGLHVQAQRVKGEKVVYVGDGLSDRCGAEKADIVFAKRGRDLLAFCKEREIPHHEYDNFADVLSKFRTIHDLG